MTKEQFIQEIAKYVQKYAPQFGIKVCSPIIAQACLESAYGTSKKAQFHNYFGLKYRKNRVTCNNGYFEDGGSEQNLDGSYTILPTATAWYAFDNLEKGVLGYFQFINIANYANLKGVSDPYQYLVNIKNDGYATSLKYVDNVYNVITKWNLTKYDNINSIEQETKEENKMLVAVEAGHGSNTAGKRTVDNYREHWINVKTAYYCEQALQRSGIDTIRIAWDDLDSTDDSDISLGNRQKMIKNAKAKVSISCHANAHGNGTQWTTAQGVETLYHSDANKANDSKRLAELVQKYLVQGTTQSNRKVKTMNLAMCNCSAMGTLASVLIEIGFMTNEYEANLMKTDEFCKEQGEQAAHGICDYLGVPFINSGITVITPKPSVTPAPTPAPSTKETYRVRKHWNDAKSQLGAFSNLENAKKACKSGYCVFDSKGNQVYPITNKTTVVNPTNNTDIKTVKAIQTWLNVNYGFKLAVDGVFGMNSMNALTKAVQKEMGVAADGKFGNLSKIAATRHTIRNGSTGNLVRLWQAYLIVKGYDPKGCDGQFGPGCVAATKEFQTKNNLKADGIVGSGTWYKALR